MHLFNTVCRRLPFPFPFRDFLVSFWDYHHSLFLLFLLLVPLEISLPLSVFSECRITFPFPLSFFSSLHFTLFLFRPPLSLLRYTPACCHRFNSAHSQTNTLYIFHLCSTFQAFKMRTMATTSECLMGLRIILQRLSSNLATLKHYSFISQFT